MRSLTEFACVDMEKSVSGIRHDVKARNDNGIGAYGKRFFCRLDDLWRESIVTVQIDEEVRSTMANGKIPVASSTEILWRLHELDKRESIDITPDNLDGLIRRAIIGNHDLIGNPSLVHDAVDRLRKVFLVVVVDQRDADAHP